jgi:hypothetical protein
VKGCAAAAVLLAGACSGGDAPGDDGPRAGLDFGNAADRNGAPESGSSAGFGNPGTASPAAGAPGGAGDGAMSLPAGALTADGQCLDCQVCSLVDLIIAVDGSGSMEEELEAMRDVVFPAFAERLPQISGGIDDFRVGTLDACPTPANFHARGAGGECSFEGGNVWIEGGSSSLQDEFRCVGDIYQDDIDCTGDNDDEQPASAAAAALELEFGSTANRGFSRDNALLVVIAITDEDEQPTSSAESAQEVHDRLVAAKGGNPNRIVFLGIAGGSDCSGAYGDADEAEKMKAITDLFAANGRGVFWDLCDGQLEDGLDLAFAVIESACNDLPPPPGSPPPYSMGPD